MRLALPFIVLALLASPAAASPTAKLTSCAPALLAADRSATFSADMRRIRGSARLQVKFVLQARPEDERGWSAVAAPGFGEWMTSAHGIGRYVYAKTVENLLAPADYRAKVSFRWLSASGRTLQRARRTTRVCRQPDLRPDLVPEEVVATADGYEVTIANAGRGIAEGFVVTIEVQGEVHLLAFVDRLPGRDRTRVHGTAPECSPGEMVIVRIDPDGDVSEAEEGLNDMAVPCPQRGHG